MSDVLEPGSVPAPDDPERTKSPKRSMAAAVLSLEAITLGLTTPVLISVAEVNVGLSLLIGLGLAVLCLVAAGRLSRPWAYALGWAIQLAAIALGLLIGLMVVLGGIFALLWWGALHLGTRIERERAAAFAAYDAAQAARGEG